MPDFYLPRDDLHVEIKPIRPTIAEVETCRSLAEGVRGSVRLMFGPMGWWTWSAEYDPDRHGGIGFWREHEPGHGWHAFTDEFRGYRPHCCDVCLRVGISRGSPPCHGPGETRVVTAARMAVAYQFDGGR